MKGNIGEAEHCDAVKCKLDCDKMVVRDSSIWLLASWGFPFWQMCLIGNERKEIEKPPGVVC